MPTPFCRVGFIRGNEAAIRTTLVAFVRNAGAAKNLLAIAFEALTDRRWRPPRQPRGPTSYKSEAMRSMTFSGPVRQSLPRTVTTFQPNASRIAGPTT